MSLRPVPYQ